MGPLGKTLAGTAGMLGAGAALHGAGLGSLLEPLDYPRQALANLIAAPKRALETGDASQLLGALPGVLGVAGTALGGPLAGVLAGGLAQGLGRAVAPDQFDAPTPHDVARPLAEALGADDGSLGSTALDLGVGMATDPLTYLGGFGAARGAGRLGKAAAATAAEAAPALAESAAAPAAAAAAAPAAPSLFREMPPALPPPRPMFYSRLEEAINRLPEEAKAESVLNLLKKAPEGVSQEELAWSKIPELAAAAKGGKVSRADLLKTFGENKIDVGEVWKGPAPAHVDAESVPGWEVFNPHTARVIGTYQTEAEAAARAAAMRADYAPLTGQGVDPLTGRQFTGKSVSYSPTGYSTPGGQNHRELLLTLPERPGAEVYHSPHWDEPNVLAHLRMQERAGPAGERVLHVDEVQSDWHQGGAKSGYKTPEAAARQADLEARHQAAVADMERLGELASRADRGGRPRLDPALAETLRGHGLPPTYLESLATAMGPRYGPGTEYFNTYVDNLGRFGVPPELVADLKAGRAGLEGPVDGPAVGRAFSEAQARRAAVQKELDKLRLQAPDAPFKEAWPELALKRVMHYAAENGFDRVSWNPGQQIKELVGGELAGQQHFYDKQLPGTANKLLKKYGAKVEPLPLEVKAGQGYRAMGNRVDAPPDLMEAVRAAVPDRDPETAVHELLVRSPEAMAAGGPLTDRLGQPLVNRILAQAAIVKRPGGVTAHSFPVTDALRRAVLGRGQPLLAVPAAAGGGALLAALAGQNPDY